MASHDSTIPVAIVSDIASGCGTPASFRIATARSVIPWPVMNSLPMVAKFARLAAVLKMA